jgi:hypothetical protein
MKNILILAFMSTLAMSSFTSTTQELDFEQEENKRLCKVFIQKAHAYEENMRDDKLARATLDSYKERVVTHCSTLQAKS